MASEMVAEEKTNRRPKPAEGRDHAPVTGLTVCPTTIRAAQRPPPPRRLAPSEPNATYARNVCRTPLLSESAKWRRGLLSPCQCQYGWAQPFSWCVSYYLYRWTWTELFVLWCRCECGRAATGEEAEGLCGQDGQGDERPPRRVSISPPSRGCLFRH